MVPPFRPRFYPAFNPPTTDIDMAKSGKLVIRKTRDLALIAKLDKKIFKGFAAPKCGTKYDDPRITWWVAYVNDRPAGFAGLRRIQDGSVECGSFSRAGVVKKYRGRAIQKALIKVREREARRLGLVALWTYTARYNYKSANSLIACGFKLVFPARPWGMKDALYFHKALEAG